jgi:DNA-binding MarR family transcriptional regulator
LLTATNCGTLALMDASGFRRSVRSLVRALGLLDESRTPCGANLSVREAYALDAIATAEASGSALSQSELQTALNVDKSNVTRVVQQLVAAGRVEQRTGEDDGRVRRLYLTAKGRRVARTVEEQSLQRFAAVLARIPAGERHEVARAIEKFRAALEDTAAREDTWVHERRC